MSDSTRTTGLTLTDENHACACSTTTRAASAEVGHPVGGHIDHYQVAGMTCAHCVSSVTEELSAIGGVRSVRVDLDAGGVSHVMVVSHYPVSVDTVRAAVAEAGYELVDAAH